MAHKKILEKFGELLRLGKVVIRYDEYQNELKKYLEDGNYSKALELVKNIVSENKIVGGERIVDFFKTIASTPLLSEKSKTKEIPSDLIDSLVIQSELNNKDKQILVIDKNYNFDDAKRVSEIIANNILMDNNKLCLPFVLFNNMNVNGRIIQRTGPKAPYTIMAGKVLKDSNVDAVKLSFLDNPRDLKKYNNIDYTLQLYSYVFRTNSNKASEIKEYDILSVKPLPILEDIKLKGMLITINDKIRVGNQATINKGAEIIFVSDYKKIIREVSDDEFRELINKYKDNYDLLYSEFFGKFRHPKIFENFMLSWLFSTQKPYGPINEYKPNLAIIGPTRGGKSRILDCLANVFSETKCGENTTIKSFVPNFGGNKPDAGLFFKSQRFVLAEEFLIKLRNKNKNEGAFDALKSLLIHDDVSSSSGKFDGQNIAGKPTSTMVFASNFMKPQINNLIELANTIDPSILSRFIIYVQSDAHFDFVEERKRILINSGATNYLPTKELYKIEIYDYLLNKKSDTSGYDINEIIDAGKQFLPDSAALREVYNGASEQVIKLLDGVTKKNYIVEGRQGDIKSTQKDFEETKQIWNFIINSWTGDVNKLSISEKINFLTKEQRQVYDYINIHPGATEEDMYKFFKYPVVKIISKLSQMGLIRLSSLSTKGYETIDGLGVIMNG